MTAQWHSPVSDAVDRPHSRVVLVALFCSVFVAHVVYFLVMRPVYPEWAPDEITRNGWYDVAENLASGRGYTLHQLLTYFSTARLVPTAARGPVPVLFLAAYIWLFSAPYYPLLITSWLLSAGNALLVYAITLTLTANRVLALVVALFTGLHLSEMYVNTTFSYASEPLFMHLLAWTVLVTIRALEQGAFRNAVTAGLLLGASCLARPTVALLPVIFAILFPLVWRRRGVWLALAACVTWAAVQVPWVLRNQAVFGRPVLTSTLGGYGLYIAAAAARDDNVHLSGWRLDLRGLHREMRSLLEDTGRTLDDVTEVELDDVLGQEAAAIIAVNRVAYIRNSALGALGIWYWLNSGRGAYLVQNGLYYALAGIGVLVAIRGRMWRVLMLLALPAYAVAVHLPVLPQYRYIVPFTPYVFVFSGIGLLFITRRLRPQASSQIGPSGRMTPA